MLTLLRLHLAFLPMLWSLWQQDATGDDDSDNRDAAGTTGDTESGTTADKLYTKEQLGRTVARQVAEARKKIEDELRAEQETKRLEDDQKWKELADKREAEKNDLKRDIAAREAAERNRILRYEIRDAARDLSFADPDDAFHLIDRDAIAFDDDGEPTNVAALVKALAERKPHLVKAEGGTRGGTPEMKRGNSTTKLSKDDIKNKYLKQAGVIVD